MYVYKFSTNLSRVRHTFITHMVERGVRWGTIQAFVGHMSARMLKHYTHIMTGAVRKAAVLDQDPMLSARFAEQFGALRSQVSTRRIDL